MDVNGVKSTIWDNGESLDVTSEPSISIMSEEVPSVTVATIVGVTLVVLIAIAAVFILGILLDCRQQRIIEKKMGEVKRLKGLRSRNSRPAGDEVSIAGNMEETATSVPPAAALRNIP